jgi:hypothetical protein
VVDADGQLGAGGLRYRPWSCCPRRNHLVLWRLQGREARPVPRAPQAVRQGGGWVRQCGRGNRRGNGERSAPFKGATPGPLLPPPPRRRRALACLHGYASMLHSFSCTYAHTHISPSLSVCVCLRACMCACVCVPVRPLTALPCPADLLVLYPVPHAVRSPFVQRAAARSRERNGSKPHRVHAPGAGAGATGG